MKIDAYNNKKLSIIISCYKRNELIWRIIEAIASNNPDYENYELLLIDSNSCIENDALPQKSKSKYPQLQIAIYHTNNVLSAKRNMGRTVSKYEWLIFIDDDCVPEPTWLPNLRNEFVNRPNHYIICGEVDYETEKLEKNRFLAWRKKAEKKAYQKGTQLDFRNIVVMNMGMHRDTFDLVGGFSELFVGYGMEDQEFGWRSIAHGVHILRAPAPIKHLDTVVSFQDYCRKMYFTGRDGARHLLTNFPEIHRAITAYKIIDPQYKFQSQLLSKLAKILRIIVFPRRLCVTLSKAYKTSSVVQRIWPKFMFRYIALFFFIEGARARNLNIAQSRGWYDGFKM